MGTGCTTVQPQVAIEPETTAKQSAVPLRVLVEQQRTPTGPPYIEYIKPWRRFVMAHESIEKYNCEWLEFPHTVQFKTQQDLTLFLLKWS